MPFRRSGMLGTGSRRLISGNLGSTFSSPRRVSGITILAAANQLDGARQDVLPAIYVLGFVATSYFPRGRTDVGVTAESACFPVGAGRSCSRLMGNIQDKETARDLKVENAALFEKVVGDTNDTASRHAIMCLCRAEEDRVVAKDAQFDLPARVRRLPGLRRTQIIDRCGSSARVRSGRPDMSRRRRWC